MLSAATAPSLGHLTHKQQMVSVQPHSHMRRVFDLLPSNHAITAIDSLTMYNNNKKKQAIVWICVFQACHYFVDADGINDPFENMDICGS